jgi:uncharacterized protein with von Willebrand factor type A (vWA) domain
MSTTQLPASAIAANCIIFGRVLRRLGLGAQPDRVMLFARAIAEIGFASRADVKQAGRCVFVRTPEERRRFDAAFDAFWTSLPHELRERTESQGSEREHNGTPAGATGERSQAGAAIAEIPRSASQAVAGPQGEEPAAARLVAHGDRSFTYSFAEALGRKDFSRLNQAELELAHELAKHRRLELGLRDSRRTAPGPGGSFDPRRTLRASLRQYGEPMQLRTRTKLLRQRDVVLLCDISGSMDRYSRLLLQFIHIMRHSIGKVEAFVFGTRLTRITRALRQRDVNEALNEVAATVADWGGGTRIGECLREFNTRWARRVLARGAIVIIISDGWDRGDVHLLATEMQRLQRTSYRLIWLNPLLGAKHYRPQTIGMRAALPYIDDFLPAHNLRSLAQLMLALRSLQRRRPVRPQQAPLRESA